MPACVSSETPVNTGSTDVISGAVQQAMGQLLGRTKRFLAEQSHEAGLEFRNDPMMTTQKVIDLHDIESAETSAFDQATQDWHGGMDDEDDAIEEVDNLIEDSDSETTFIIPRAINEQNDELMRHRLSENDSWLTQPDDAAKIDDQNARTDVHGDDVEHFEQTTDYMDAQTNDDDEQITALERSPNAVDDYAAATTEISVDFDVVTDQWINDLMTANDEQPISENQSAGDPHVVEDEVQTVSRDADLIESSRQVDDVTPIAIKAASSPRRLKRRRRLQRMHTASVSDASSGDEEPLASRHHHRQRRGEGQSSKSDTATADDAADGIVASGNVWSDAKQGGDVDVGAQTAEYADVAPNGDKK